MPPAPTSSTPPARPAQRRRAAGHRGLVALLASLAAGAIATVGAEAVRHVRRRRAISGEAGERAATTGTGTEAGTDAAEGEERERAALDVLASDDPARLVVFALRRARGYAEQARRRAGAAGPEPSRPAARRHPPTELERLLAALDGFRVSGVPADDLLAVRRLERWAATLASAAGPTATDRPSA